MLASCANVVIPALMNSSAAFGPIPSILVRSSEVEIVEVSAFGDSSIAANFAGSELTSAFGALAGFAATLSPLLTLPWDD